MKTVLIISLQLILVQFAWAQLDYYPEKHPDLDEKQYQKGIHILENTYSQIKNNNNEYTYGDYWNMMYGYIILKEPKEKVLEYLALSKQLNEQNFSYIFTKASSNLFKPYISEADYEEMLKEANKVLANEEEEIFDPITYADSLNLNKDLIVLMHDVSFRDQKFRSTDMDAQQQLDKMNQAIIDSLLDIHKGYVGSNHVGKKFDYVMWLVVQHSNLEMMKRYLPYVHKAVENEELAPVPLKMLLDRIHSIEHKTQIFGSQGGVDFADQNTIDQVKEKYNLK